MGFYKEKEGPELVAGPVLGDSSGLYLEIPTHLRNRLEVVVGSRFVGSLMTVTKKNGKSLGLNAGGIFDVKGYWNEMHLPDEMVRRHSIEKEKFVEIKLHQIIGSGRWAPV